MKKLDLYIIKKFLLTFVYIMAVIMAIAIVFDISEKVEDFIKNAPPFKAVIFQYYLNFVLFYSNLFSALLIFIAVIFFTAKMAGDSEIVAILSSGVSFKRLLVPYFIAATILTSFSLFMNHQLIPKANEERIAFENAYIRSHFLHHTRNIHQQIAPGEFIYFNKFNTLKNIGYHFSYEKWDDSELRFKLMSRFLKWDSADNKWRAERYFIREIDGLEENIRTGSRLDTTFNFIPSDFEESLDNIAMMNTSELNAYIEQEKEKGSEMIPYYLIEKHQRTSYPLATYILTVIGVAISSRKSRGGIGLHIALGLLICVTYILCMKVTTVYATNAGLDPFIAVWLPNILFAAIAVFILKRAPK